MSNPFDQFDSGGAAVANPFDKFDKPAANPFDAFDQKSPIDDPAIRAKQLSSTPDFDPVSYAAQNPNDADTAFAVDQLRKNRSPSEKIGAALNTATSLSPWKDAAGGVLKFGAGTIMAPLHSITQAGLTTAAPVLDLVGQNELAQKARNEAQSEGAEAVLAGQKVEEGLKKTGNALMTLAPSGAGMAAEGPMESQMTVDAMTPEEKLAHENALARQDFNTRVDNAKNQIQLATGKPLDSGAVAALSRAATGVNPSEAFGPENLQAIGARPASQFVTDSMAASGDPQNLVLAAAPGLPGAKLAAGGGVELAGKALQLPMRAAEAVPGTLGKVAKGAIGAGAAYEAYQHPESAVEIGATILGAKLASKFGKILESQGNEFRTGNSSDLTQAAAAAQDAGKSSLLPNAGRLIGSAAVQGAATAYGFAPYNAATSDSPEDFAKSEAGAAGFGAGMSALHAAPSMRAADQALQGKLMEQHGQSQLTNNPAYPAHEAAMAKLDPQDQSKINRLRSFLFGGTDTDVLVVDGNTFAKTDGGQIGQDARGKISPDGNTIYINADAPGATGSSIADTTGHEAGHAIVKYLSDLSGQADSKGLIQSISDRLTDADKNQMANRYWDALENSTKGITPGNRDSIRAQIERDNPPRQILEENLAEITRSILAGKDVSNFSVPKSIMDKISDATSRMMEAMGMSAPIDPNASLGFKMRYIKDAARRMQDVLYDTGRTARSDRASGPTAEQAIIDLQKKLSSLPTPTPDMKASDVQDIAEQRDGLQKRLDSWNKIFQSQKAVNPSSGKAPVPPSAPSVPAPQSGMGDIPRVAAALRLNGLSATEALQWASAAQGKDVSEKVIDALKQRANQKFPNAQSTPAIPSEPVPVSNEIVTQETPKEKGSLNEGQVSPPKENEPLPAGNGGVLTSDGEDKTQTEPLQVSPEDFDGIAARARETFLADKAPTKAGKNKGQHTQKNQDLADRAAFDAVAAQHAQTVPENYQGIKQRTDAFGKKFVSGNIDPSRPFDSWLINQATKAGNLNPDALKTLLTLQGSIGKTVTFDYGHAPTEEAGEQPTKESRAAQQAQHSVAKRLSGESPTQTEAKTSIPLNVGYNPGSKSFTVFGASPEKLLNNFNHLSEAMAHAGIEVPYRDINDPRLVADIKAVIRNHQNGWQGDGSRPSIGTDEYPNVPNYEWKNSPEHVVIPPDGFDFVNAMLADEGAKSQTRDKSDLTTEAKAKAHLANENRRLVNESGETNELRQKINDSIGPVADKNGNPSTWSKLTLEDPLSENVSPALASNVRESSQSDESIRQHGKVGDLGRFFENGRTPNRAKTAAGFLPTESTPEGEPTAPKEAGQPQAGSLNPLGASGEDSNKPEDGATPAERLAREAEEAGVMLSMATIRAMIRNDHETMNKIRARIETATGKPARFLPAEKYDPSQDNTPIVNEGQPAWITRFERLWNKELSGGLTKDEEDAVDAYHQKAIRVFGSLSNYEKLQKEGRIAEFLKAKAE